MAILKVGGTHIASSSGSDVTLDNVALGSSVTGIPTAVMVHLATYTGDNTVATTYLNLGSYASYNTHILRFENVRFATDSLGMILRVSTNTTALTTGYQTAAHRIYATGSATPVITTEYNTDRLLYLAIYAGNDTGEPGLSGEASVFGALSSLWTSARGHVFEWKGDGYIEVIDGWGMYQTAVATPYLHLVSGAGNFVSGNIILYGVNNA